MSDISVEIDEPVAEGEPFYIRQHGGFAGLTPEQRQSWFGGAVHEAKQQGATWVRLSVDSSREPTMALVEAWKVQPKDEGPVRWQLTRAS